MGEAIEKIAQNEVIYGEGLSPDVVEQRLSVLTQSLAGLQKIGQQMLSPLKRDLLYEGKARMMLMTYKLALGEEAVFDADIAVPAAALSIYGLPYQCQVVSDRVRIDTAPISTKVIVRWNESNFRKFDILNRAQERAKASIQYEEDSKFMNLLSYAANLTNQGESYPAGSNNPTKLNSDVTGRLSLESVIAAITTLRSKLVPVSKIFMNPYRMKDVVMFNYNVAGTGGYGIFAPNLQEQAIKAGRMGTLFNCEVIESIVVPQNKVYVLTAADYLGVLAVRTDITVATLKDPNQFGDVFTIWEDIGMVMRWVKGIAEITIPQ